MFLFALFLGFYSYILFFLGIIGLLYKSVIIVFTLIFFLGYIFLQRKSIAFLLKQLKSAGRGLLLKSNDKKLVLLLLGLFGTQAVVNFVGVLGPELAFDALWYHLTLPKLYLESHSVFFIPGGLLYYSAMPKLAEMLYIGGLSFGNEITVKVIHFIFGLLTCLVVYKLSRKFFTPFISFIAVIIFYANLVVAWESTTAYVDLVRAFFEVMALWAFINWDETKKQRWLVYSAIMVGLAITTKLLAIGSLVVFITLIVLKSWKRLFRNFGNEVKNLLLFIFIVLTVPLPWLLFAYVNTGNPVYPFFSEIYKIAPEPLSIVGFFKDIWNIFMYSPDPISPLYLMVFPLIVWLFYGSRNKFGMTGLRLISLYSLLAIIVWYFTPRTGGGRFILPYLPAFSLLCAAVLFELLQNKKKYGVYLGKFLLVVIIFVSFISIGYRFVANTKYLPVILGTQTKEQFLSSNLNFSFSDFYDTDGYFKENIKSTDTVLLYGFHNLYYVDFPFIDATWVKPGDEFNYIATQNTEIPEQFRDWNLIYTNEKTMVKLYRKTYLTDIFGSDYYERAGLLK